jgi:hypothetical protein
MFARRPCIRLLLSCTTIFLCVAVSARSSSAQTERKAVSDLRAELDAFKAETQERLKTQEGDARKREEDLQKQNAAAIEAARKAGAEEAEKNLGRERADWRAANQKLQEQIQALSAHEDAREQSAPPRVRANDHGLWLGGYVQSDYVTRQSSQDQLNPTSGAPLNQDRIMVRRARLLVDYRREYGGGGIELDGNTVHGATARLLGAQASLKLPGSEADGPPLVMGSIGAFRIPFGLEALQPDTERAFMERTTASRAFFPSEYDLGLRLQGGWRFLRYAAAVMNGEPVDERTFPAIDPNHQKDVIGRVGVDLAAPGRFSIVFGVSALYGKGFHSGSVASKPVVGWIDSDGNGSFNPNSEINGTPGMSATASQTFSRFAVGSDIVLSLSLLPGHALLGATTVLGEFIWASNLDRGILPADPYGVLGRDAREIGYFVGVTQAVARHGVIGFRYDFYDPDRDRYVRIAGDLVPSNLSYRSWQVMAGLVSSWGRLLLQYDVNRNHLGLSTGGTPANLADNTFTLRGEVRF